jgi:crotonobetainyl-CoA:carnitine CoA-transferase CaiB-like acyl-CoA transferase
LAIDITKEQGLAIVYHLIKSTDIVVASYKPGDAEKLKVDYGTLAKINPTIIFAHVTGYGLQNERAGFDAIIQAESGFVFMNGDPSGPPTKMPVALMDVLAAHHLKEAILLALFQREREGEGCYIDASLYKAGVSSLANQATNWLVGKYIPQRLGSDHPNIVPYGTIFNTSDGKGIVLAVGTEKQFTDLCTLLGKPHLANNPKFRSNQNRVKNREEINTILQDMISKYDREKVLQILAKGKVPAGGVFNMQEVFQTPEAQEMVLESTVNGYTINGVSSIAFNIDGQKPEGNLSHPPHYGEHTRIILEEVFEMTKEQIDSLINSRIVFQA